MKEMWMNYLNGRIKSLWALINHFLQAFFFSTGMRVKKMNTKVRLSLHMKSIQRKYF